MKNLTYCFGTRHARDVVSRLCTGEEDDFVIGILTGTVSQGKRNFVPPKKWLQNTGKVITATYPDNFNDEVEQRLHGLSNWYPMAQI